MKRSIILLLAIILLIGGGVLIGKNLDKTKKTVPPRTTESLLSEQEARIIAEKTCIKGGDALAGNSFYNENSKTWWFDANLNATRPGCNPACVVSENKTAEINWRCTGAIPPPPDRQPPAVRGGNVLDLSNQGLDKLPMDIFDRTDLTGLNVSGNRLTGALPSQIGNLKKLVTLDASNNLMTGIPAEIGRLTDLEYINYANNRLTGLPNEIANLKNLKTIDLTGNDYSTYDMSIIKKALPNLVIIGEKK